jgi:nitroreductase
MTTSIRERQPDDIGVSGMSVSEAVASRRTIRDFTDRPVPYETLLRVMEKARLAPSGSNFQPWEATILTGEPLRLLREKMNASPMQQPAEYIIQPADIPLEYPARLAETTAKQYEALGIARDDKEKRMEAIMRNIVSFDAPVLLLCYLPRVMGPPQWSDTGMWLQTIMLLLREEGLDSCPQEFLSMYGRLIKEHIGVSDETHIFFCGMGIGYRTDAQVNNFERHRVPLERQVRFMGF